MPFFKKRKKICDLYPPGDSIKDNSADVRKTSWMMKAKQSRLSRWICEHPWRAMKIIGVFGGVLLLSWSLWRQRAEDMDRFQWNTVRRMCERKSRLNSKIKTDDRKEKRFYFSYYWYNLYVVEIIQSGKIRKYITSVVSNYCCLISWLYAGLPDFVTSLKLFRGVSSDLDE